MDEKPYPPTVKELFNALWIAGCAHEMVQGIIEKGRPSAQVFVELCHSLYDLECSLPPSPQRGRLHPDGAAEKFYWRAEEIESASRTDGTGGFLQLMADGQSERMERILDLKFDSQKSEPRE